MIRLPAFLLLIFAAVPSGDRLDRLAAEGLIQDNAPVKTTSEITINASPERVWALLTDVNSWPKWQGDISEAEIRGPLQPGIAFVWTSGTHIRSRIALVRPPEAFA